MYIAISAAPRGRERMRGGGRGGVWGRGGGGAPFMTEKGHRVMGPVL